MGRCWKKSILVGITSGACAFLLGGAVFADELNCDKQASSTNLAAKPLSESSQPNVTNSFSGNVSWYGGKFNGRKTASGEIFDIHKLTAAHRRLPFSVKVLVENPKTGQSCIVKVNDRGPYVKTRVLDVSQAGMRRLDKVMPGVIYADCLVLDED